MSNNNISVTVTNAGEVTEDITKRVEALTKNMIEKDVHGFVEAMQELIVSELNSGNASGETYQSSRTPNVLHVASAPGEYPASDTGTLARSVSLEYGPDFGAIYTDIQYGRDLEMRPPSMGGRPWMTRGYNETLARWGKR